MRIGLASLPISTSRHEAVERVVSTLKDAAERGIALVCFPETYVPGYGGLDFPVIAHDQAAQQIALEQIRRSCRDGGVGAVVGMEWQTDVGLHNVAVVINPAGDFCGYQAKNQMDPSEDGRWVSDGIRKVFHQGNLTFGIAICHEGWRYPETVRWAARRGAQIVFHPQATGSDKTGSKLTHWGSPDAPYYEKAMIMRSIENGIYFASVNYAMKFQESATSLIAPDGSCVVFQPYGEVGLLSCDLDLSAANGILAQRYRQDLYPE